MSLGQIVSLISCVNSMPKKVLVCIVIVNLTLLPDVQVRLIRQNIVHR